MEFKTTKIDEANATINATIKAETIEANLTKLAKEASKTMDIQGFRKGKVPVAVVKSRYADKLTQDAEGEAIRDVLSKSLEELEIDNADIIGEPAITKFDKAENGDVEVEIKLACKPSIELGDYKSFLPEIEDKEVTEEEVNERITTIASQSATFAKVEDDRAVENGDFTLIDFEGFKDGVAFDGGKAQKHSLEIGSNSFIPGFEEQVIGMKADEDKDITLTFPENYQAKDLAGAEVVFKVKLHEIQEKVAPTVNDELAKKILGKKEDEEATVEELKEKVSEQIKMEKMGTYYNEDLKPAYLEILVENIEFAIPTSVLDQEINQVLNNKVREMSEDDINELKENQAKIEEMRVEATPEATQSVKATFIVDALAKIEKVEVSDQEVTQTLYYEAMMQGQDGQALIKQYEEAGYLPAIKMSMIEQKVITQLLDEKAGK
ncbi:MAG: trigger factor [Campylobacterota bacterium]|nr:trigger factor [Campylobacterota bacterium]